ncbi:hypothetical protein JCM10207_005813 [Rhodosporidiobolus poonsookiae]
MDTHKTSAPSVDQKHTASTDGEKAVEVVALEEKDDRSFWRYLVDNRRSFGWCIYILMLMVGYGFDGLLTGSLVSVPAFKRNFGYLDEPSQLWVVKAIWQSLWQGCTAIAMIIGSLIAGQTCSRLGLRLTIALAMIFSVGGILFEQLCHGPAQFLGAKCVAGIGYGLQTSAAIMSIPSYAPTRLRGTLGAALNSFILFGGWLAQGTITGTGQVYPTSTKAYQIPFGLQYIFVGIIVLGLPFLPEPASLLLRKGNPDAARAALSRLYGPKRTAVIEREYELAVFQHNLDMELSQSNKGSIFEPFFKTNIRRTMVSVGVLGFQQLVGATFVTSYLTYFYSVAGTPEDLSLSLGEIWYTINKLGRRHSLVGGLALMTVVLIIIGITWAVRSSASLWCMVAFMTIWAFFYQMTIGATGYSVAAEAPSPRLRPATIGIAQAVAQVCAWGMGFATPYMINPDEANLGGYVGFVFAGICGIATVWAFFSVPETAGRTNAEIDEMWAAKVPVRHWKGYKCAQAPAEMVDRE